MIDTIFNTAHRNQILIQKTNHTKEHTELAIAQIRGGLSIYEDLGSLEDEKGWRDASFNKKEFNSTLKSAKKTVESFADWLEETVLEGIANDESGGRSFRLGKSLYAQKFELDLIAEYTSEEIFMRGIKEKNIIHQKMKKLTEELWPKYFGYKIKASPELKDVKILIDKISENHVARDEFVSSIRTQLPELENFVREKDILYINPEKPLEVRETPKYMRGIAGASISAPGPYEKDRQTFYNVTPLDQYTEEEAESYLKEYNHYILQILNIHEAIPGHYTQLVYANNSPSLIKSLFGNGTMIEGWACYVERMMIEEGYGNNEPEMWLMYYKWNLREICNALIDIGVHTKNWDQEKVMDILVNEAFQEKTEAEGKYKRVSLSQVQLCSYYTGLSEIYDFRESLKKENPDQFDLKLFHTQFLSFGSAPIMYIKELMMKK